MYQEILSSNKTNYRFSRGNLTLKTDTTKEDREKEEEEEEEKREKSKKHFSIGSSITTSSSVRTSSLLGSSLTSPSLTSPSLSFQSQTQDPSFFSEFTTRTQSQIQDPSFFTDSQSQSVYSEEEVAKRMEELREENKNKNKISISKTFSSFMEQFDEKIKNNDDSNMIDNESTIRYDTSNVDNNLNSVTPTEEYFNKALSELAALSNLSKKK